MSKKLVMAKAIFHVKICDDLPYYVLLAKATICWIDIFFLPNMYVKKLFRWATFPMDFIN